MSKLPRIFDNQLFTTAVLAAVSAGAWAAWLGWDQPRDLADGREAVSYAQWQVIGLVLTLALPVFAAASRQYVAAAVVGTSAGLSVAAYYDWSADDGSGLFVIGVGMIMFGCAAATGVFATAIARWQTRRHRAPGPTG
ncbi:hypothetical protein [Yinghuangia soli]|uniref:Uncharacterized protein n=1 Tax=Yinghuangia soli TaxID=2908204 RepID=A0AA41Q8C1_9ACTN|nr:hypothetical protein [Yinghuangia soli]MCF2533318.1 hypothetical protein [Yinghuangia soli]